ncbi:MAG: hypothetical protein JSR77_03295 [Planctomycetes bacterium]|nr:hypothetical protein [Planctomycetota bacterium]
MDRERLRRIIDLAAPLVEQWVRKSPSHRELAAEIAAWLESVARHESPPRPPANSVPASSTPNPASSPSPNAPHLKTDPASRPKSPVDPDLITKMLHGLNEPGLLAGGISRPPQRAAGVAASPPITTHEASARSKAPREKQAVPAAAAAPAPISAPKSRTRTDLAMQKAHYHRSQLDKCLAAKDDNAAALHVARIAEALDEYLKDGGDPAEGDAEEVLNYAMSVLPKKASLSVATERLIEAVSRAFDESDERHDADPKGTNDVRAAAAALLNGRIAVLIGGDVREDRRRALEQELGLRELRWLRSTPTNPALKFEADLKRADVDLVLLAIRWVRHATGYAVADACTRAKKPIVRLTGGLGTNSVASAVMSQAGEVMSRS